MLKIGSMRTGELIQNARKQAHLSVWDLADYLGVSDATVYSWECGKRFPRIKQLINMADIFGCAVDDLIYTAECK